MANPLPAGRNSGFHLSILHKQIGLTVLVWLVLFAGIAFD